MHLRALLRAALLATCTHATLQIVPGATWTATNTGSHVQAHGAGITKVGSTYYLIGEDKTNGTYFLNVNCYSSTNLVDWKYEGALLSQQASGDLGPGRIVERPKVIYNDATKQYVMWMHIDSSDYKDARTGVAVGSSVCGKYEYKGSWRPLGFQSRDMGLFKDDDGKGYLMTEDRENGLRINALTSDYLNTTGTTSTHLFAEKYESPALVKASGTYFIFASQLTGWSPNDNYYATATSLAGPWSSWKTFADVGSNTYSSQTSFVVPIQGATATSYLFGGDRWVSTALFRSTYVWLPLTLSGTTASLKNYVNWAVDAAAGTWAAGPTETQNEGEDAALSGGAKVVSCSGCSGGDAAGYVGGTSAPGGIVTWADVSSDVATRSTVRVKYQNLDGAARFANVAVNGAVATKVAFLPTVQGTPGSSVVNVDLKAGAANEVVIEGVDGWGPDVDRLMVPRS